MAGEQLESKIRITGDSTDAERAINATLQSVQEVRADLAKSTGKVALFEQAQADAKATQDAYDATARKLEYFREQAKIGGETGAKAFAVDIRAAEKELDKLNSQINRQAAGLRTMSDGLDAAKIDTKQLASEKERLAAATLKSEQQITRLRGQLLEERTAAKEAATQVKAAGDAQEKMGQQAGKASTGAESLVTGFKVLAGAAVVKEFFQANEQMESLESTLYAVTGSTEAARAEMEFIRAEAQRLGVETAGAAQSYIRLAAATKGTNLEGQATREIWSAVAGRMAELGASTADVEGAMTQLAQGASKGKFELEDLKSIAERIPGFFKTFADSLGVSTERFFEMVSAGEITADKLPKLAAAIGGSSEHIDTFRANMARMKNTFSETAVTLGDTGILKAISEGSKVAAFGVTLLVNEFVLLGKSYGNVAYSLATLDFTGFLTRQKELVGETTAALKEAEHRILGTGKAAEQAGAQAKAGLGQAATAAGELATNSKTSEAASKDLAEALKTLGLDTKQFADTGKEAAAAFDRIAESAQATGDMVLTSLLVALDKVGKDAAPALEFGLQSAFQKGRLSAEQLAVGLDAIKTKSDGLWEGMAKGAETAAISTEAWAKTAQAAVDANNGIVNAAIRAEAAQRGYEIAVDNSGRAVLKSYAEIIRSSDSSGKSARDLAGNYSDVAARAADAAAEAAYLADETERAARVQRAEARRQDGATVYNRASIIDELKSYGVDEATAREESKRFVGQDGFSVPYFSNRGQMEIGGSTLSESIARLATRLLDDRAATGAAPAATTVYKVDFRLPTGQTTSIQTATAADAKKLADLTKQLERILQDALLAANG